MLLNIKQKNISIFFVGFIPKIYCLPNFAFLPILPKKNESILKMDEKI
jgi:hypothetical protein